MMKEEKADEIMAVILKVWEEQYGKDNIDPKKVKDVRKMLLLSPHEDGLMPVKIIGGKGTHTVPIKNIILKGLRGKDVEKYPLSDERAGGE